MGEWPTDDPLARPTNSNSLARLHPGHRAAEGPARPRPARGARLSLQRVRDPRPALRGRPAAGCGWRPRRRDVALPQPGHAHDRADGEGRASSRAQAARRRPRREAVMTEAGLAAARRGCAHPRRGVRAYLVDLASTRRLRGDRPGLQRGQRPAARRASPGRRRHPLTRLGLTRAAGSSVAGQPAVGDAVRARGLGAEALDLVRLVGREVALEPEPLRRVLVGRPPRPGCGSPCGRGTTGRAR